jgi:hypothetical protein
MEGATMATTDRPTRHLQPSSRATYTAQAGTLFTQMAIDALKPNGFQQEVKRAVPAGGLVQPD